MHKHLACSHYRVKARSHWAISNKTNVIVEMGHQNHSHLWPMNSDIKILWNKTTYCVSYRCVLWINLKVVFTASDSGSESEKDQRHNPQTLKKYFAFSAFDRYERAVRARFTLNTTIAFDWDLKQVSWARQPLTTKICPGVTSILRLLYEAVISCVVRSSLNLYVLQSCMWYQFGWRKADTDNWKPPPPASPPSPSLRVYSRQTESVSHANASPTKLLPRRKITVVASLVKALIIQQWQIQDFREGWAPTPKGGIPNLLLCQFFPKAAWKLRNVGPMERGGAFLAYPRSANNSDPLNVTFQCLAQVTFILLIVNVLIILAYCSSCLFSTFVNKICNL